MSFWDKFRKENNVQSKTNSVELDETENTTVEITKQEAEQRDDIPSANEEGRDSGSNKKMITTAIIAGAVAILVAGLGLTYGNYQENKKAKADLEAEEKAKQLKNISADTSNNIAEDQRAMKENELTELTPPAGALEAEETATAQNAPPTVEPVNEPIPAPQPQYQPQYNNYNGGDGGMVAGRDYAPPAPIEQPTAPPINMKDDEEDKPISVVDSNTSNTDVLVDVYGASKATTTAKSQETGLAGSLKSSQLANGSTQRNEDKSLLLSKGTTIPCVMKTKINSTYQGFTTCQVAKDVYSANGKVLLIERGSSVFGEQNIQIQQGQARVAVLWSKIETPKGVSISLDSPATGQLGEMGVGAKVNNHFWKRFGGAIMLSMIQDGFSALSTHLEKDNENGNNNTTVSNTTSTAENMMGEILKNTINMPPTATVNQGSIINIMVVRDVDFGGVYKVSK